MNSLSLTNPPSVMRCDSWTSAGWAYASRGYAVSGRDSRCARWCSLANGNPQYVQLQISGLSVLMKILGCPNAPPPPSHATIRSCVHRTGCWWIKLIADCGAGCISIMVCSNLGPDIAFSLGFWLRDHFPSLFGACITLNFSAVSTLSCNGLSWTWDSIGNSLDFETLGTFFGEFGSLISCWSFAENA